jgi:hypothetical protein
MLKLRITTQHADYEKLFGGTSVVVEVAGGVATVTEAARESLIGETIELSADGDPAEQLAAMYSADVELA